MRVHVRTPTVFVPNKVSQPCMDFTNHDDCDLCLYLLKACSHSPRKRSQKRRLWRFVPISKSHNAFTRSDGKYQRKRLLSRSRSSMWTGPKHERHYRKYFLSVQTVQNKFNMNFWGRCLLNEKKTSIKDYWTILIWHDLVNLPKKSWIFTKYTQQICKIILLWRNSWE